MQKSWPPSCSHGTYQYKAITSRSRQLLMMGTWLHETYWATIRREIKNTKVTSCWFFLSTLNYDARPTTHQIFKNQHKAITSRSRQLLMMAIWLPETCWATSRREIKYTKVTSSRFFLSTLNYDARWTTHQISPLLLVTRSYSTD